MVRPSGLTSGAFPSVISRTVFPSALATATWHHLAGTFSGIIAGLGIGVVWVLGMRATTFPGMTMHLPVGMLASLAVAWAGRDLTSYVDGLRPSTWSSTVTVHGPLDRIETRPWLRHPGCCCSWE